ncbi:MAG: ATP-binding cassette domain-containing protein [Acidobacteria bacterium]|nr:ATP-binding cassette domain-containing protein [Acidobacteriota bacterium]
MGSTPNFASAPGTPPAAAARGVGVSFGGLRALDAIDIEVTPGAIVGIIGPNGAGKTTLFDCLSGFLPCEGRVWVAGKDVTGLPPHGRAAAGLGRSFQDARLFHTMTVLDTLRVASELHLKGAGVLPSLLSLPSSRAAERRATETALELIDLLGLGGFRDKLIRELSTGTRRIVDLGCVLAQDPSVVLLDEPSSGIAQRETEALGPLLRRLRDRTGCAMLLIEHDMPLLMGLAERVYALEAGKQIAEGTPEEVVNHPEVIRSYLGADASAINRSDAEPAAEAEPPRARPRPQAKPTARKPAPRTAVPRKAAPRKPAPRKPAAVDTTGARAKPASARGPRKPKE